MFLVAHQSRSQVPIGTGSEFTLDKMTFSKNLVKKYTFDCDFFQKLSPFGKICGFFISPLLLFAYNAYHLQQY
jgi:hypothetical protein